MSDKSLKWASCCGLTQPCQECDSVLRCRSWCGYVKRHGKAKGYAHFDKRTSLFDYGTRVRVLNPEWVSSHSFWPLIHVKMKRDKFGSHNGSAAPELKRKYREIRYCAHIDRCVYQRYSFLINEAYNHYVEASAVDACAIAYRTDRGRDNIDFAKEAFRFIEGQGNCIIVVTDFTDFFESVDHRHLKLSICKLLGVDRLPKDYFAVFKNSTRYSSWEWSDLLKLRGLGNTRAARKKMNDAETVLSYETFRANVKRHARRNGEDHGIPQGSPISAVFSNVYLMGLDEQLSDLASASGGLYRRYCDDVLIVLPVSNNTLEPAMRQAEEAFRCIEAYPGLEIQEAKTKMFQYQNTENGPVLIGINRYGEPVEATAELDYLGFSFNGFRTKMRAKTISKYHYRMRRKAHTALRQGKGRERLYARYSDRSWPIEGKGTFVDYARRARGKIDLVDPSVDSVSTHSTEKIAKMLNRLRNKS